MFLQADQGGDVPRIDRVHVDALVGLHHHDPVDPLPPAGAGVVDLVPFLDRAAIDAEENQLAHVRIAPELEGERAELGGVVRRGGHRVAARVLTLGRGHVQRGGEVIHHGVHQRLNAALAEGGAAHDRDELDLAGEAADGALEGFRGDRLVLDDQFGDLVILVRDGVHQFGQGDLSPVALLGGNVGDLKAHPGLVGVVPDNGLGVHQVDEAPELILLADGEDDRVGVGAQLLAHLQDGVFKVGAGPVHFVDEGDAGHAVLGGLAPDRFGLGLDAGDGAEDSHRPVQHAHGPLHLGGEIHVAGSVNDVDAVGDAREHLAQARLRLLGPIAGGGGGGDGDAALALLLHPVGHGVAIVHIAHLVDQAGVEEDAFGAGGLAGINVGGDADVAGALQGKLALGRVGRLRGSRGRRRGGSRGGRFVINGDCHKT